MGGKNKTQRTKNNSRPSNSGRSAELLGASIPSFVGFSALSECGYVPVLPGFQTSENLPEEMDPNMDSNYQLVFRKMTKKDPITKVKALQEFAELVGSSELEAVKLILPFWPRLYGNLASDVEHRVREAAQQAHAAVALKSGKNIAPFLKQLAPSWITSQYDTYPPAASIASASLKKAFPAYKMQEVFNYCQNEVLDYTIKNVTVFTPATLSNPKTYSAEECEAKYQRLVICSLQAYALYLTKMTPEQLLESSNKNSLLVDNAKFWSFHKHKVANVRAAWFEAFSALLQYATFLIVDKHEQQATVCALQSLDETEPIALPHVWACILLVTQKIENWPQFINMEKALLPKLWKVLKSGGNGNAAIIYPHLLPLVAKLNKSVLGDKIQTFYEDFFVNLNIGLKNRTTNQQSRSDISAIATSYYECLQYVCIQIQTNEMFLPDLNDLQEYCENLVAVHVLDVVKWTLCKEINCGKFIFTHLASLLNFWCQSAATNTLYDHMLKSLWTKLYQVLDTSLDDVVGGNDDNEISKILDTHFDLVQSLRQQNRTKHVRVKFSTEQDEVDGAAAKVQPKFVDFNELAYRLCTIYIRKTTETNCSIFINSLENLLKTFGNEELFSRLSGESQKISKLYDKFAVWLLIKPLRQENVVDIVLMLYQYVGASEKNDLLNKLIKFPNEQVQSWALARMLSHPFCTEPDVTRLLAQPNVTQILLKCATAVVEGETKEKINFLHKCFFQNEAGDILIDRETCEGIIRILAKALTDESKSNVLDTCASFLAQIMPVICSDEGKKSLQHFMFMEFFQFSVSRVITDDLSEDTLWEITTSWQDALSSNDLQLDDQLLETCSAIVDTKLNSSEELTIESIENIAEIVSKLILCSIERIENEVEKYKRADTIIDTIFNQRCKEYKSNLNLIEHLCLFLESINTKLTWPQIAEPDQLEFDQIDNSGQLIDTVNQFLKMAYFKFNVIFKITCGIKRVEVAAARTGDEAVDDPNDGGDDECTDDFCDLDENLIKNWSENIFDEILDGIYVGSMGNSLINYASNLSFYAETVSINITERVILYLKNVSAKYVTQIKEKLFQNAQAKGLLWTNCLLFLLNNEQYNDNDNGLILLLEDATIDKQFSSINYVNILQAISSKVTERKLPIQPEIFADNLDLLNRSINLRCLIGNYFQSNFNESEDRKIIDQSIRLIGDLQLKYKLDKEFLLYNEDISKKSSDRIVFITEIANFISAAIQSFPRELDTNCWDLVRIALSSWVLSVSKTSEHYKTTKVSIFISAIYRLFSTFSKFVLAEKQKSSSELLSKMIEEWDHLFAKDVNLILLKCYMRYVINHDKQEKVNYFLECLSKSAISEIDFNYVLVGMKIDSKTSMDDLIGFALDNLSNRLHSVRSACSTVLAKLSKGLIAIDIDTLNKRNEIEMQGKKATLSQQWHLLHKFESVLQKHRDNIQPYIDEFSFKSTELDDLTDVPVEIVIPYLFIWDSILNICARSSSELRSIYASYLTENKFEQTLLPALFRFMPDDILRNQDAKHLGIAFFAPLPWVQICDFNISYQRFACYIYSQTLRHLPAVARKWWHDSNPRQKILVDKITTSFVSPQLCADELRALIDRKEKHDNMQITVHTSTREVLATYAIDEARMELIVTLPVNHPLGTVKVESGKQIGGRLQSRVLVMQLTIFLTHQNGSIWDGLSLWKRNLDRKFEGVEECYVCYSVIHQDTCQLPKLSCKTCKKKFHGPCLYKWFSTSNKSTCPICRNIF